MSSTHKPHSPSCERNREPILAVLRQYLDGHRRLLEIGSGTGQHAVCFAAAFPQLVWQCSDIAGNLPGIRQWLREAALPNTPDPIELDVNGPWPSSRFDAIFTANTLHIMSWPTVMTMFARLPRVMTADARLIVYGPFNYGGHFTSDSNARFDDWLKERGEHQGIRDFEQVVELARQAGCRLLADHAMPANNRTLVWERDPEAPA